MSTSTLVSDPACLTNAGRLHGKNSKSCSGFSTSAGCMCEYRSAKRSLQVQLVSMVLLSVMPIAGEQSIKKILQEYVAARKFGSGIGRRGPNVHIYGDLETWSEHLFNRVWGSCTQHSRCSACCRSQKRMDI